MFEKYENLCGIYKINFPNDKYYIGKSINIKNRLIAHNKANDDLPIHRAIKKFGKITENNICILEICPVDNTILNKKEIYWIKKFDSTNPEKGYNLTFGGDGAALGVLNTSAKLNEAQLELLIKDLIDNKIYIKDLAEKYNLSARGISDINCGKSYYNKNLQYPLRPNTRFSSGNAKEKTGFNKESAKFSEKEFLEIVDLLINSKISLKEISIKFNCSQTTISKINNGKCYYNKNYNYPLRKTTKAFSEEKIEIIYNELKNTNKSMKQIAEELGVGRSTIERINSGKTHRIENYFYPIRNK